MAQMTRDIRMAAVTATGAFTRDIEKSGFPTLEVVCGSFGDIVDYCLKSAGLSYNPDSDIDKQGKPIGETKWRENKRNSVKGGLLGDSIAMFLETSEWKYDDRVIDGTEYAEKKKISGERTIEILLSPRHIGNCVKMGVIVCLPTDMPKGQKGKQVTSMVSALDVTKLPKREVESAEVETESAEVETDAGGKKNRRNR